MSRGPERKMNFEEFHRLINNAYKFLGVECPKDTCEYIFKSVDKDEDGLITYVEYFKVIELYVCKGAEEKKEEKDSKPTGPERHSKLRAYIWTSLRRLYDGYVQGRSLQANDAEIRELLFAILGQLSLAELSFLASGLLRLNYKVISFEQFAVAFIYLVAELGLSRYSSNHSSSKRTLDKDEFVLLLINTYSWCRLSKFKKSILYKIFAKIDKNNDGLISFEEYLDWVKRFLAVLKYYGDQFYVLEDDEDNDSSDCFEDDAPPAPINRSVVQKFNFSDYSFARKVRARVLELLIPYDKDQNKQFDEKEIQDALIGLLKEDENELKYVTKNVFRYDRDNNG